MVENMPNAVNKIQWIKEITSERPEFSIKIYRGKELVYHNKGYAGIVNVIQSQVTGAIEKDGDLSFDCDSQVFGFGNPVEQLVALDQARIKLRDVFLLAEKIIYKYWKSK